MRVGNPFLNHKPMFHLWVITERQRKVILKRIFSKPMIELKKEELP